MEIPLELVLSGRDLTEPKLSPDGRRLAYVERVRSAASIIVVDLDGDTPPAALTFGSDPAPGRGFGGGCFDWLPDGSGVVYAAQDGEIWMVQGADLRRITEFGRDCRAPAVAPGGSFVVVAVDEADIWLLGLDGSGSIRLDDGRHEFCFDPAVSPDGSTVSWMGWSPPAMPWDAAERVDCGDPTGARTISSWRPDGAAVQQPRFACDGIPTCVHDAGGWLNVHVGDDAAIGEPVEHAGPTWGMGQRSYAMRSDGGCVIARNERGFGSLAVADRGEVSKVVRGFTGVYGQLSMVGDRLAAVRSGPSTPTEIIVVDPEPGVGGSHRSGGGLRVVASAGVAAWSCVELPVAEPVEVDHHGVRLHARRYGAGYGRLLCWVHGGPTDQWPVEFRPRIAYWWSRGWDVLVVDPRGTTGHGRQYQQALNGAWGRIDVDDTAALIGAAHANGWSTPATTVVIGGSSGGLTVLGVLADHADLVAGGVASSPVSDIRALADATHRFEAHYTETLVGPSADASTSERFVSLSPLHRAAQISGPLLLFHGTDDPVVPKAQSDLLVERMIAAGGAVDYVVYDGEGHGFRDPINQRDEYERTEAFLARILASI